MKIPQPQNNNQKGIQHITQKTIKFQKQSKLTLRRVIKWEKDLDILQKQSLLLQKIVLKKGILNALNLFDRFLQSIIQVLMTKLLLIFYQRNQSFNLGIKMIVKSIFFDSVGKASRFSNLKDIYNSSRTNKIVQVEQINDQYGKITGKQAYITRRGIFNKIKKQFSINKVKNQMNELYYRKLNSSQVKKCFGFRILSSLAKFNSLLFPYSILISLFSTAFVVLTSFYFYSKTSEQSDAHIKSNEMIADLIQKQLHIQQKQEKETSFEYIHFNTLKKYGEQRLAWNENTYLQNNSIQKQLNEIFLPQNVKKNKYKSRFLKLITGPPGIGKTTAIHYLVTKMRSQSQQVYYVDLKQQSFIECQKQKEIIVQKLLSIFSVAAQNLKNIQPNLEKQIKIIINGMNRLPLTQWQKIFEPKYIDRLNQRASIFLISNSYTFTNEFRKVMKQSIISSQFIQYFGKQYEQLVQKIILYRCPNFPSNIMKIIKEQKYNLNEILFHLDNYNSSQIQMRKQLESQKNYTKHKIMVEIRRKLIQHNLIQNDKQTMHKYLSHIINSYQKQIDSTNCSKIDALLGNKSKKNMAQFLDQLHKDEILIFCRPSEKIIKEALEQLLQKFSKQHEKCG